MKTLYAPGNTITCVAPVDGVKSGDVTIVGGFIGIAATSAAEGQEYELSLGGVHTLDRATGGSTAWAIGDQIYWDDTAGKATKVPTDNTALGLAAAVAGDAEATGRVRLHNNFPPA